MLKVENIYKKFTRTIEKKQKEEFYANKEISFEAKDGEILGILGPNGAGKTTLLRMCAGIIEPTDGKITYDGKTISEDELEIKRNIAYLSGNTKIYNSLSPYELLKMCAKMYDVPTNLIDKKIKDVSLALGMDKFLYNRIEKLSTGQVQRVNIARCLIHDPKYYILDEATSGLDILSSQIILDFIKKEAARGKTVIYSTHYMEEAENICDNCIMIDRGTIIETGTPEEIKKSTNTTNLRDAFFEVLGGKRNEQ